MKIWQKSSTGEGREISRGCLLVILIAGLFLSVVLSLGLGPVRLTLEDLRKAILAWDRGSVSWRILFYSRLPRTLGTLAAGAALSVSGALIQTVLDNPLAAPNVIGVNAGAGLAVTLCGVLLPTAFSLRPWAAFFGALGSISLVLLIGERIGASRLTLVLSGIAVSAVCSGGVELLISLDPDALGTYADFRVGGFAGTTMARVSPAAILILLAVAAALALSGSLDVLALGEETAQSLGLLVRPLRFAALTGAAALAGAAVSIAGLLGFVGLIVPHTMRGPARGECFWLFLYSALGGALFVTFSDLLTRILFAPYEVPVGILLSFVGGPFFLGIILRQHRGGSHVSPA